MARPWQHTYIKVHTPPAGSVAWLGSPAKLPQLIRRGPGPLLAGPAPCQQSWRRALSKHASPSPRGFAWAPLAQTAPRPPLPHGLAEPSRLRQHPLASATCSRGGPACGESAPPYHGTEEAVLGELAPTAPRPCRPAWRGCSVRLGSSAVRLHAGTSQAPLPARVHTEMLHSYGLCTGSLCADARISMQASQQHKQMKAPDSQLCMEHCIITMQRQFLLEHHNSKCLLMQECCSPGTCMSCRIAGCAHAPAFAACARWPDAPWTAQASPACVFHANVVALDSSRVHSTDQQQYHCRLPVHKGTRKVVTLAASGAALVEMQGGKIGGCCPHLRQVAVDGGLVL